MPQEDDNEPGVDLTLPQAESMHRLSGRCFGLTKRFALIALALQGLAAALAMISHEVSRWPAATSLTLLAICFVLRRYTKRVRGVAEETRRRSLDALIQRTDCSAQELSLAIDSLGPLLNLIGVDSVANYLWIGQPKPLRKHYDSLPENATIQDRQRVAYAMISFWTGSLLARLNIIYLLAFIGPLIASVLILYIYATAQSHGTEDTKFIIGFLSFTLSTLCLHLLNTYLDVAVTQREAQYVAGILTRPATISAGELELLCDRYNYAAVQCPPIPDWIYDSSTKSIKSRWEPIMNEIGAVQ